MTAVDLPGQIAIVRTELARRQRHYPAWVGAGKMTQNEADREVRGMMAVLATLEHVHSERRRTAFIYDQK